MTMAPPFSQARPGGSGGGGVAAGLPQPPAMATTTAFFPLGFPAQPAGTHGGSQSFSG